MKSILLISTSLSKESISANLIKFVNIQLKKENVKSKIIDLREFNIPFCDGRSINEYDANIQSLFNDLKNIFSERELKIKISYGADYSSLQSL